MVLDIRVLTTGGTIAATASADGAVPNIEGDDLLGDVPRLADQTEVSVEQVAQVLSFAMDGSILADICERIESMTTDAVVITHGTDTMEESAYYLDVALAPDRPIVFTGAQRRPDEPGADGPANLSTALTAATELATRSAGGSHVAFNEELHAARDVVKAHTHKLEAFESPGSGPVATERADGFRFVRRPNSRSTHVPARASDASVEVVSSGIGVDGAAVRRAIDAGVDGLVLQGTGLGNVAPGIADAVGDAVDRGVPTVLTSRCHAGEVAPVYGTPGGGQTLVDAGVIPASDLTAAKARIKLMLALEAVEEPAEVRDYFE